MADDGQWVTINGTHILIKDGESKEDAISEFTSAKGHDGASEKQRQIDENKKEADRLNAKKDSARTIANEKTQSEHEKAIKELSTKVKDSDGNLIDKYQDGTYNLNSLKSTDFDNGFQVTFCQIGDSYSNSDYANRVNEFSKVSSDGQVYAGKFEGTPEVSFHVTSRSQAIALAKKYNQISVWDWKSGREIKTGGTGKRGK